MSVDYRALLYIGRKFEDQYEAQGWYERFVDISEEDQELIDEEDFSEYLYDKSEIEGEILNSYNGQGFVLGFDIGSTIHDPEMLASKVTLACIKWKDMFDEEPYEIIHTVKVY